MPDQIGADLLIVEGAGHGVTQQCPAIVNDALLSLFSRPLSLPRNPVPEIRRVPASYVFCFIYYYVFMNYVCLVHYVSVDGYV